MFRSVSGFRDQAVAAWVVGAVRAAGLVFVLITVSAAEPRPVAAGQGLAVGVALAVSAAAWIAWMLAGGKRRLAAAALMVMGLAGGALAGLSPSGPALVVGCMAVAGAGAGLPLDRSVAVVAGTVASFASTSLTVGRDPAVLFGYIFAFAGLWSLGLTRRAYIGRAEQAELMLAEARRAHQAEAQAAAIAERARIAREIHDVLAHSLAAVSVNLQAAEGLLTAGSLPAGNPELVKALDCVTRAGTLTRDGLAAARRAVLALREDEAPLPELLSSLAAGHRADCDPAADLSITGQARPVPADVSLTVYRTAQEALTNAAKHAPGEPIVVSLGYEAGQVTVTIVNPLPGDGASGPLAATGAGYGLTGLRERAALAGGVLAAGPAGGTWRVCLRIPA